MVSPVFGVSLALVMYALYHYYTKTGPVYDSGENVTAQHYVQPNKMTAIHRPKNVCTGPKPKKKLLLIIVVHSHVTNYREREIIRKTWGCYSKYKYVLNNVMKLRKQVKDNDSNVDKTEDFTLRRKVSKRVSDENYQYDETTAVDANVTEENFINRICIPLGKSAHDVETENPEVDFKLVFLVGMPENKHTDTQNYIKREALKNGDILQENFVDSLHLASIKSVYMLKWLATQCNGHVRYVLKTNDDIYVNMPYLVMDLLEEAKKFDEDFDDEKKKEYLLMGKFECDKPPRKTYKDKWFPPSYMYKGRKFPCFATGLGYVMSQSAVVSLYKAALETPLFLIEYVFITGICREAAKPIIEPKNLTTLEYDDECHMATILFVCTPFAVTFCRVNKRETMFRLFESMLNTDVIKACDEEKLISKRNSPKYKMIQKILARMTNIEKEEEET